MKIAVLADEAMQQEWIQKGATPNVEIEWAGSVRVLTACDADVYVDLLFENDRERTAKLSARNKLFFINSVSFTTAQVGKDFIRINAWAGFLQRSVCEVAVGKPEQVTLVRDVFNELGWNFQLAPDVPGMISARIIAMIINEAYFTFGDSVSTKEDIDIAMKLGTNYPMGPFEWSEKIGLHRIYELLKILNQTDKRYQVAPALEQAIKQSGNL